MRYMVLDHRRYFGTVLIFFILLYTFFITTPYVHAAQVQHAIVTTVDSNGLKGSYSWIAEAKSGGNRLREHNMMPTIADIRVASYGQYYFILEGGGLNRITLFDIVSLDEQVRQYETDALPWDMVFVNEHKAYLLRHGSSIVWIVDPLAEDEADFKIGELDFSAYDDGNGAPEMCCGVVVGTKAFIALQRLAAETAYLAVFDTEADLEINTGQDAGPLLGVPFAVRNPVSLHYLSQTQKIYIQGSGAVDPPDYTGGIESVDPNTYATSMVVDDGDNASHPYGYITAMAIISSTDGFFIGAADPNDNTLYHFNPSIGAAEAVIFSSIDPDYMQHKHLAGLTGGIGIDRLNRLWIGNMTDRQVEIIKTTPYDGKYSSDESVAIPNDNAGDTMLPTQIVFCLEPAVTDADEAQKPNSSGEGGNFCFIGTLRSPW